jgi:flagellar basal-body rod protein FlgB
MIFDAIYKQSSIMGSALQASAMRNDIITNNIANADLPEYKAKVVDFEASLIKAIEDYKKTGVLDLSGAKPSIRTANRNYNYRIDKNNVDVELEMVNLYQNSIKYEAMINCVQRNSARLNLALTGR